jgi:tRNA pseudouridine synthase 10
MNTLLYYRPVYAASCACSEPITLPAHDSYCSVCLGILLPVWHQDDGLEMPHNENISSMISRVVQKEGFQVDEFSLEISLPAVIAANERAFRLYMKQKFGNEDWFKDKMFPPQTMSAKEALRLLIVPSLEKQMNAKHGSSSFRIRLTYTHGDASQKLHSLLPNEHSHKRKPGSRNGSDTSNEAHKRNSTDANNKQISESDSFIYKTLESMHDQEFCNLIQLPPEKVVTLCCYYIIGSREWENSCTNFFHQIIQSLQVSKPCHLVISCLRSPIYIGGRYLKVCSVNPLSQLHHHS